MQVTLKSQLTQEKHAHPSLLMVVKFYDQLNIFYWLRKTILQKILSFIKIEDGHLSVEVASLVI
ncbi:hypothetical protein SPPR111872_12090 [Sphingobacterium prati]